MPWLRLVLTLALSAVALSGLRAATPLMPIAEVRPGMVGVGRTVFFGTRVEEFKAHVIGVLENVMAPQRNLILARLEGGPLAETGVIAGMSGSPVYIDGRLIGAVSYSMGSFPKEPIAGITPIEEMVEATNLPATRPPAARVQIELPLTRDSLMAAFRQALSRNGAFADRTEDVRSVGAAAGFDRTSLAGLGSLGALGPLMRPIATPLVMSGFEPAISSQFEAAFRDYGFIAAGGGNAGTRPGEMPFDGPLKPGDAIGVLFVNGDFHLGGTGTVTHVDGDRVYAFGHPMYNIGPTQFPMTRAYVYTVLPSLFSSSKLSTTGEIIGTLLQDRATAIAGRLGSGPRMIPITVNLEAERGTKRTFKFGVVRDQLFAPLMTFNTLLNVLAGHEREFGAATYSVQGKVSVAGRDPVVLDNLFSGDSSPMAATSSIIGPLAALMSNDIEEVDIQGLDLSIRSAEEPRTATLQRVWIDDPRAGPGKTVPLKVLLRTYRGDEVLRTIPIQIPATASGTVSILVSDGQRLTQAEQREARAPRPRSLPQLIRRLNDVRRNNTLYVKLLGTETGAVVNGELLASLPPSVLAVLEADRSGGSFNPLYSATLGEWELPTAHAVSGVRTLTLSISPN
jgi:hypothetical protein